MSEPSSPSSTLGQKLRSSLCLPSPFRKQHAAVDGKPCLTGSSSTSSSPKAAWIKSCAGEIPEIKDKCVSFISRIGKHHNHMHHHHHHQHHHQHQHHHHGRARSGHHRRHSISADFRYDALSYSLNFDEGLDENEVDEFPLRRFSSRLPLSPTKEIDCIS